MPTVKVPTVVAVPVVPEVPAIKTQAMLDEVASFVGKYVCFPKDEHLTTVTLWIAHTHVFEAFYNSGRLAVLSAEKESGKTRLLDMLQLLTRRPLQTASLTAAALFGSIDAMGSPTMLIDECDVIYSSQNPTNQALRGILNAGYQRGAKVLRSKPDHTVHHYNAYAPVALAGIGDCLPDTVISRSVVIRMKRKPRDVELPPYYANKVALEAEVIRARLALWADQVIDEFAHFEHSKPFGIQDRPEQVWQAMLCIAESSGTKWTNKAHRAVKTLTVDAKADNEMSPGVRLLHDIRELFTSRDRDRLTSMELVTELTLQEQGEWSDRDLDERFMAKLLKPYEISPTKIRVGKVTVQGYHRRDFVDAWSRYLAAEEATE